MADCVVRVRSRIDPVVKAQAVKLFEHMGLSLSQAIRLFVYQSVAQNSIPFSINKPNIQTQAALKSIEQGEKLEHTSLKKLSEDWDK